LSRMSFSTAAVLEGSTPCSRRQQNKRIVCETGTVGSSAGKYELLHSSCVAGLHALKRDRKDSGTYENGMNDAGVQKPDLVVSLMGQG